MRTTIPEEARFETGRLDVSNWHAMADGRGIDLASVVATLLTPVTTRGLPPEWRGAYSVERARRWIAERDRESPTLAVVDRASGDAIGLLILYESHHERGEGVDLRVGYLFRESVWGRGLATELLAGLVAWARTRPAIATLTAGVDATNAASARVLSKTGFVPVASGADGEQVYRLRIDRAAP